MRRRIQVLVCVTVSWLSACAGEQTTRGSAGAGSNLAGGAGSGNSSAAGAANGAAGSSTASGAANGGGASVAGSSAGGSVSAGADASSDSADGLSAAFPADQDIESHPAVLFADDFESYADASGLSERWDAVYQGDHVVITTDPANVYAGNQALEFNMPVQAQEISNATDKILEPEQDVLYLRYYSKFQSPYDIVGSSHNGSMISAHYFMDGNATPGMRADGTNKFLVALENWRGEAATPSPGLLNLYVYHPEQRDDYGDHWFPTGLVSPNTSLAYDFGDDFVPHDEVIPELDRWYCYEYGIKANTPGSRDGEVSIWLDGELLVTFRNLRFRDVESLKMDRFGLSFHIHDNANGDKKYFDNVVAATEHIGTLAQP